MTLITRFIVITILMSLLLVSGCTALPVTPPAGDNATQLEPVKLGVGFIPNVQFAPIYVGMAKGFFAEEGVDLELNYGFENDYLKLVGVDEYQFMIGSGDQVVLGRAQGLPVRYVLNWYTRFPVVIFSKAERGITTPADLAGKTIGIPGPFGASYVALRGILEAGGLTEQDVRLESIGFTQAAAISENRVEAATDYAVSGPVVLRQAGVPVNEIVLDDYLVVPSNGLITNDHAIAKRPELVQAMARAMHKAIAYTLANPDEAFAIALQFVPEAGGDNEAANRAIFDASLVYWTPRPNQTPGATDAADWQATAEFMQRIGLVETAVEADSLFTNEFVPEE